MCAKTQASEEEHCSALLVSLSLKKGPVEMGPRLLRTRAWLAGPGISGVRKYDKAGSASVRAAGCSCSFSIRKELLC